VNTGNYTSIPLSATCKLSCNQKVVRLPLLSRGAVTGIIVGVLLGVILAISVVVLLYRRYVRSTFEMI